MYKDFIQNTDIDIYCSSKKCPICGSKIMIAEYKPLLSLDLTCRNECYSITFLGEGENVQAFVYIFGDLATVLKRRIVNDGEKVLVDAIKYWRDNERYLIRVMEK